jgi:hypothetical protein
VFPTLINIFSVAFLKPGLAELLKHCFLNQEATVPLEMLSYSGSVLEGERPCF